METLTEHYLDNSATTQVLPSVAQKALELMTEEYGNPSSLHTRGFRARQQVEEARAALSGHLGELARTGQETVEAAGYDYPVTASLEKCWFPTKEYDGFALPAGEYTALRVVIGEGNGQNWWCVVFPPLCLGSVSETAAQTALSDGFTQDQVSLITGEDEGYVVKFKAIELWEEFQHWLSGT